MKKLVLTLLTLLTSGAVHALPIGNPAEASLLCDGLLFCKNSTGWCNPCGKWWGNASLRAGYYGDFVFQRFLRNKRSSVDSAYLDHSHITTNAAYLALNVCNRFDVFTTLGATRFLLEGNISSFGPNGVFVPVIAATTGSRVEFETNNDFSWSIGARASIWQCGCTLFGIEGQYFRASPTVSRVAHTDALSTYLTSTRPNLRLDYSEWQVGLGVSHRINFLVPYVAIKWSGSRVHWENTNAFKTLAVGTFDNSEIIVPGSVITLHDLRSRKFWGYAVGVSLADCTKGALTVEARFASEIAFYTNAQVRF